ncbi:fMet-Leu-Phe receptor [Biomphalaria glabrata]|nr:fMet-Leu-Phe receptor [Biomphalaria glabrata]
MANMTAAFLYQDFSPGQMIIGMEVSTVLSAIISAFGILTNTIVIRTFMAMGPADGMTVAFLLMSLVDLTFSAVSFSLSISTIFLILETLSGSLFPVQPYGIGVYFANLLIPLSAIISLQTSFIAIARCLCVAAPFYFKNVFTRSLTLAFMVSFTVFSSAVYVPVFVFMGMVDKTDNIKNLTRPMLWVSPNREPTKSIVSTIIAIIIPLASQLIVIVTLVVMATSLRNSYHFRLSAAIGIDSPKRNRQSAAPSGIDRPTSKTANKECTISSKEMQIIKQVALLSALYVVCHIPKIMFIITGLVLPEFNLNRELQNLYLTMSNTRMLFEMINSASNFPIYFKYNSKFRKLLGKKMCRQKQNS